MKYLRYLFIFIFSAILFIGISVSAQTIPSVSPWFVNASNQITQRVVNTAIYLSGMENGCLQVTGGVATSTGINCGTGSGGSSYPFPLSGNATSTLTQFNGGLTAYASSTISGLVGIGGMSNQDITGGGSGVSAGIYGDFAGGSAQTPNTANSIIATNAGSFAYGASQGLLVRGSIQSTGVGSFAIGDTNGGFSGAGSAIIASGAGSFAGGFVSAGATTTATNSGSFAWGNGVGATASLATAFGTGYTNSTANSFDIGYSSTPSLTVTGSAVTSNENIYDIPQSPLSGTYCLQINTSGEITNTGSACSTAPTYTVTYPVTLSGSTIGLAFSTTTTNSWSGANTFTNGVTTNSLSIGSLTGVLQATSGAISTALVNLASQVTGILGVANGGTATSTAGVTNGVEFNQGSYLSNGSGFTYNGSEVATAESLPATSTAITLNWTATPNQVDYQIGTSATTITLINATTSAMDGSRKIVWICNPNASAGTLTWAGVEWVGSAPTQTTTASQCDVYSFDVTSATSTSAYKVAGSQGAGFQ